MHDSKLLELIKKLDPKECRALVKFVRFHKKSDGQVIVLLEYILKIAPDFESEQLSKKKVFEVLYPDKKTYNDVVIRRCMSRLFQLSEEFIVFYQTQNNDRYMQIELMNFYGDRRLDRHFNTILRNWKKQSDEDAVVDDFYFLDEFRVEKEISAYIFSQQDRTADPNLKQTSDNLDSFFLMHKLKLCCTSITYQTMSNTEYELPMMDEMLDYLEKKWTTCHPVVQAYYFALLSLVDGENENHFRTLKKILFLHLDQFHHSKQIDLFSLCQNYCSKRSNKGDKAYLTELFELYKVGLEKEIVLKNGVLSPFYYKNIVTLGTRLQAFDWTENFIESYTNNLEESFRESAYHYNLARLFFSKKEFEKIIDLLRQVEHREMFVDLAAKVLLLKTYYELEEIEPMMSLVESFRMFLSRKKNLGYYKSRYQNFLKFLRQLTRLKVATKAEKSAFKEQVLKEKELIEKEWFVAKL